MAELTAVRVRELLHYNSETGIFTWKVGGGGWRRIGAQAGNLNNRGYLRIKIDGRDYAAHRLAWLYAHGEWPKGHLDHVNRVKADNRMSNLRLATRSQNRMNAVGKSSTGFKGVYWNKSAGKFLVKLQVNGKQIYRGLFTTAEKAHKAYCAVAKHYHGEFACFAHRGDSA